MIKRYIFLDIDGVMVNYDSMILPEMDDNYHQFHPTCVDNLNRIIEETNTEIVISSSWRNALGSDEANLKWIRDIFIKRGFKYPENIIGQTIRAYKYVQKGIHLSIPRGVEIKQWLDINVVYPWIGNPERDEEFKTYRDDGSFKSMRHNIKNIDFKFAIIDDDVDFLLEHKNDFFQTYNETGLTEEIAEKIINKFK
jgi:hypothetical protein